MLALEIYLSGAEDPALLFGVDGLLGQAEPGAMPSLDLDEAENVPILRHEVDFPDAGPKVPGANRVPRLLQMLLRQPLPLLPHPARSSHPRGPPREEGNNAIEENRGEHRRILAGRRGAGELHKIFENHMLYA